MSEPARFQGLVKIPAVPAAKIVAAHQVRLKTKIEAPAAASVGEVLAELDAKGAQSDVFHLLAHALPPREAVWWACLGARDMYPADGSEQPKTLTTAEAWVFGPSEETRQAAREALDNAAPGDKTKLCAMAAAMSDGKLGPGELAEYDAPPGATGAAVFGMVTKALYSDKAQAPMRQSLYLDRALDIARGGNGRPEQQQVAGGAHG
ncbi:MAG: hypothetical protein AAF713_16755 [Pseudomonadota bacterium]